MAFTMTFYKSAKDYFGDGGCNLNTADLRLIPLSASYTFSQTHDFANDLTNEVTTLGGTRVALSGESWALSGNNGRFDCDDIVWTASGGQLDIRYWALVDYTGSSGDADRELIAQLDPGGTASAPDGSTITILTPSGLFEFQ